jgi:hypothetical protein
MILAEPPQLRDVRTEVKRAVERFMQKLEIAPHVYLTDDDMAWFASLSFGSELLAAMEQHGIVERRAGKEQQRIQGQGRRQYYQRLSNRADVMEGLLVTKRNDNISQFWSEVEKRYPSGARS